MIIDCHTRIWASPDQLGQAATGWLVRHGGQKGLPADPGDHAAAARDVAKTLVWGFRSRLIGADIPNAFLADYVSRHADNTIGIAGVDPAEPDVMERLGNIAQRSEFAGITVSPAAQGFHPCDTRAMRVYEFCQQRGLPVFVEAGTDLAPSTVMEFARPYLFDEVAREMPALTIVLGSVGWPWTNEAVALLAKQPQVFADVAGLIPRLWPAYQTILEAHRAGVSDKLLFGSGFPFATAATAIEQLYRINEITRGTNLPAVPREVLRGIVERDALKLLGIS